jgi:hypothetical protein
MKKYLILAGLLLTSFTQVFAQAVSVPSMGNSFDRTLLINVNPKFLGQLKSAPQETIDAFKAKLKPNDIILFPLVNIWTKEEAETFSTELKNFFPDNRIYTFIFVSKVSQMFNEEIWQNNVAGRKFNGVSTTTLKNIDGILIDYEEFSFCRPTNHQSVSDPARKEYNDVICANNYFPQKIAESQTSTINILKKFVTMSKTKSNQILTNDGSNHKIYVGLVPYARPLRTLPDTFNFGTVVLKTGADGQSIQTQETCKTSTAAFTDRLKKISNQYSQAYKSFCTNKSCPQIGRNNLSVQLTVCTPSSSNACVTQARAFACLKTGKFKELNYKNLLLFGTDLTTIGTFLDTFNRDYRKI